MPDFKFKWLLVNVFIGCIIGICIMIFTAIDNHQREMGFYVKHQAEIAEVTSKIQKLRSEKGEREVQSEDGRPIREIEEDIFKLSERLKTLKKFGKVEPILSTRFANTFGHTESWVIVVISGIAFGPFIYTIVYFIKVLIFRFSSKKDRSEQLANKAEKIQENLGEDFFNSLVRLNFNYLDSYYLQTQTQADKSFLLAAIAASISFIVIVIGIIALFLSDGNAPGSISPAEITVGVGAFGEFISAVFFYLYNRTVLKMGEYHQKLVLTQNIASAIKITSELPESDKAKAQQDLVKNLVTDINMYLTKNGNEPKPVK